MDKVAIRIDDFGASTKKFEIYGKTRLKFNEYTLPIPIPKQLTNFLFFKKFKYWKGWGPYEELSPEQIERMIVFCKDNKLKFSLAVTAGWVDKNSNIIPFDKKFPKQLNLLKKGVECGVFEILSHGLTHCIVGKHLPKNFSSNRKFHREFYDYLPKNKILDHLNKSKDILENAFNTNIDILVPPGNVYGRKTIEGCLKAGYKILTCNTKTRVEDGLIILGNENIIDLHDKDFVEEPITTYERLKSINSKTVFVSELVRKN